MARVMIVEDVDFNRDLLVQLLEEEHEVLTAGDGAASLELAARESPDIILMDISLPVIDGLEAVRRLKADPALKRIPVIAVTAHAMQGDREKALAAGCDGYITKPIDEDQLFAAVRALLPKSGQEPKKDPEGG